MLTLDSTKKSWRPKEKVSKWLKMSPRTPDPFCDSDFLLVLLLPHKDSPRGWEGMHSRRQYRADGTVSSGRSPLPPASSSVTTQLIKCPLPKALSSRPGL